MLKSFVTPDQIAYSLLTQAGLDPESPPNLRALVSWYLGDDALDVYEGLRTDATLIRSGARWLIWVRPNLSLRGRAYAVAHQLTRWWLRVQELARGERIEELAKSATSSVLAPGPAVLRVLDRGERVFDAFWLPTEEAARVREAEVLARYRGQLAEGMTGPVPLARAERSRPALRLVWSAGQ